MNLKEKVAYLVGLAEGLNLEESKEAKLLNNIIDVLQDFAEAVQELDELYNELEEYLEAIDTDLEDLETDYYETDEDETDFFEFQCPNCNETVYLDESLMDEEIFCPNCHNKIDFVDDEEL